MIRLPGAAGSLTFTFLDDKGSAYMSLFQRDIDYLTLLGGLIYCLNHVDVIAANNTLSANLIGVEINIGDAVASLMMFWTSVRALVYPEQISTWSPCPDERYVPMAEPVYSYSTRWPEKPLGF